MSRCFSDKDLEYLDPISETEEEVHDERVKYMEKQPSVDEAEVVDMPGFSDFRARGIQADIETRKHEEDLANASSDGAIEISAESTLTRRHQATTSEPADIA